MNTSKRKEAEGPSKTNFRVRFWLENSWYTCPADVILKFRDRMIVDCKDRTGAITLEVIFR